MQREVNRRAQFITDTVCAKFHCQHPETQSEILNMVRQEMRSLLSEHATHTRNLMSETIQAISTKG